MSHQAWVSQQGTDAPPALVRRVQAVLQANPGWEALCLADALLKAGEELLAAVLGDSTAGRDVALDLLAADACVTWAFEAAADAPISLQARAEQAMEQIAGLAK
jgi:hypothetical protein